MATYIKPGVELPESVAMIVLYTATVDVFQSFGHDCTITSGVDGKHGENSLHYAGRALDFRTRTVPIGTRPKLAKELRARLGANFDVVEESDHLHVEWDPKHHADRPIA